MDTNQENSVGPVVGVVIILVVIVLGGLYFWGTRGNNPKQNMNPNIAAPTQNGDTSSIDTQSSSDDFSSIEADLNSTNTTNLDSELNAS